MKKLIFLLLVSLSISASAQLFVTLSPKYIQPGIMYSNQNAHAYIRGRISYVFEPNTTFWQYKIAIGGIIPFEGQFFLIGLNKNKIDKVKNIRYDFNSKRLHLISFEIGFMCKPTKNKKLMLLVLTDWPNFETDLGIRILF